MPAASLPLLLNTAIFVAGLVILYFGADWLIRGAASLALKFGIRPLVVGLTVVALATSMPEFLFNFMAVVENDHAIALGNIIGSNICNIALILGLSALVYPLVVTPAMLRKEYPIVLAVSLGFYALAVDGTISSTDGLILVAGLVGFLVFVVVDARRHGPMSAADFPTSAVLLPTWKKVSFLAGGMIVLALGARLMVLGATGIAAALGIDSGVVGLTVVAIGTSLPELAASVMCAIKKEADMSIGNILGSNLLNVLFVVGLVSIAQPLRVEPASIQIHFPVMIAFTVLLLPIAWTQYRITRTEGGVLLAGFLSYMVYLVLPYV